MKKPMRAVSRLAASMPHATPPFHTAEATIRALRAASNLAIADADLIAVSVSLAEDFIVIIGDGTLLSREDYIAAFAHTFEQPVRLSYNRIADKIHVATSQLLAAEHGHWIARLSPESAASQVLATGTYMAMWQFADSAWKLRSELFVSLT